MSETRPRIGRIGAFRARREGVNAAIDGQPATANPYRIDPEAKFEERIKATYWARGYARATMEMRRNAQ